MQMQLPPINSLQPFKVCIRDLSNTYQPLTKYFYYSNHIFKSKLLFNHMLIHKMEHIEKTLTPYIESIT